MEIRERQSGRVAVLDLVGRLTVTDQPGVLKDAVSAALRRGARHVALELSGVPYLDSTRLGELIAVHVSVARSKGQLRLVRTPPRILELLGLAGLLGVFELCDDLETAIRELEAMG